jgi:hypothetical protein
VDPNPALVEELEMLKVSLEAALGELAETTKHLERTREKARHYRGLWMSECRYNKLLSRELPPGASVDSFSQARDWDNSSPYYMHNCKCEHKLSVTFT